MLKRLFFILIVLLPFSALAQKKIDARSGKGKQKVSKPKDQAYDRMMEIKKDEERQWNRSLQIQDRKTKKRMEKNRKKARKQAIRRANRNKPSRW